MIPPRLTTNTPPKLSWRKPLGLGPVSYTHLDVYKRQVLAQPDANGKIWGKTTVLSGVQVENTASVAGVYTNVSEFTWTSGHLITDTGTPPSYNDTWQRMGALSLRCETALLGVLPPDLTLEKTLITAGPYTVGQSIQYTLIPKNIGFGPAATGLSLIHI